MNIFLVIIHVIACFLIIFIVLLQVGRGAELGAAFGGLGQANVARGTVSFVGKFTAFLAVTFMVTSFFLTYNTASQSKSSVIDKISVEEQLDILAPVAEKTEENKVTKEALPTAESDKTHKVKSTEATSEKPVGSENKK